MRKLLPLALLSGLVLSACGSAPGQLSGSRVSVGLDVGDANSKVTVTRTYTPEKVDDKGNVTPASETWAIGDAGPVEFVFMSRPGSDAMYITGWRITRYDFNGRVSNEVSEVNKLDIYVPSGWTCPERASLPSYQSCPMFTTDGKNRNDVVPANGLPTSPLKLNFAGALVAEVQRTLASAYSQVDIDFTGYSSNNQPVVVKAKPVLSYAYKAGN